MTTPPPFDLGPMPERSRLQTVDERMVPALADRVFDVVRAVDRWPVHLRHYRSVVMRDRRSDGGGVVTMAATRPFGPLSWPVWWVAEMQVLSGSGRNPSIRFRHIDGVTRGMQVEWSFTPRALPLAPTSAPMATFVRIVHRWDGPRWPLIGGIAGAGIIGPVFIHGIASRTLAGLASVAARESGGPETGRSDDAIANSRGANVGARA
jgi:hypothetical protein